MATRPVFCIKEAAPYYSVFDVEFVWAKGLALCQRRKNIDAIHRGFEKDHPNRTILEISGKSSVETGVSASAFNLRKYVPSIGAAVPVENIYQSSKVFSSGGPYTELLTAAPIDAKRDERLKTSEKLIAYRFEEQEFGLLPQTAFYDFIYIKALTENPRLGSELMDYDGFTDIAFNPKKGINCQARSAAVYVSLQRLGLPDQVKNYASYLRFYIQTQPRCPIIRCWQAEKRGFTLTAVSAQYRFALPQAAQNGYPDPNGSGYPFLYVSKMIQFSIRLNIDANSFSASSVLSGAVIC